MVDLRIGRHGVIIILVLFLTFAIEDILIWINRGAVPGIEFFVASIVLLVVFAILIRDARNHRPPEV